eukprot:TRINITY_DN11699_c1_g2_i1.p1 TRINITY_DN11699_c1_g2~~TRINITY_DN11699_c1_g2_i1.p1  ORF type:complete len:1490 (+),score=282.91 TRINITY_DN11699_c1_g2_i1:291-4472(+)
MDVANGRNEIHAKLLILENNGGIWRAVDELIPKRRVAYIDTNVRQTITFVSVLESEMMIGVSLTCALFISPTSLFPCEESLVYIYKKDRTQHWQFSTIVSSPLYDYSSSKCNNFGKVGAITPAKRYISLCNKICTYDYHYNFMKCGLDGDKEYKFLQTTSSFLFLTNRSISSQDSIYYQDIYSGDSLSFVGGSFGDLSKLFATDEFIFIFSSWILTVLDRGTKEFIQQLYFHVTPADVVCLNKDLYISDQSCNVYFYVFEAGYFVLKAIIKPNLPFSISQVPSHLKISQNLLVVIIPSFTKIFQIDIHCIKYGGCTEYCARGKMEPFQCVPSDCSAVGGCQYPSEECAFNGTGFSCFCSSGYQKELFLGKCENINECSKSYFPPLHNCKINQLCVDTPGSFTCRCVDGLIESVSFLPNQPTTCVQDFTPTFEPFKRNISSLLLWEDLLFMRSDLKVFVYKFTKNQWILNKTIQSPIQSPESNFGWAMTTNGHYLAISVAVYKLTDLNSPIIIPSIFDTTRIPFYIDYLVSVCNVSSESKLCPWNYTDCVPDLNSTYFERFSRFGHSLALNTEDDLVITAYDGINPGWTEVWHIDGTLSQNPKYYFTGSVLKNNASMSSPCNPDTEYALLVGEKLFSFTKSLNNSVDSPNMWSISRPNSTILIPDSYQFIPFGPISSIDYYSNYVLIGSSFNRQAILLEAIGDYWGLRSTFTPPPQFPSGYFGQAVSFDKYDGDIIISDPYYNYVYLYRFNSQDTYYLENIIKGEKADIKGVSNFGDRVVSYGDKIAISNGTDILLVFDCPNGILSSTTCQEYNACDLGTHNCQQICNFTESNYIFTCDCYSGYQKHGPLCIDINECTNGTHDCTQEYQNCHNLNGTYECYCDEGCIQRNGTCYALPCIMEKSPWKQCPENLCLIPSVYRTLNITRKSPHCPSILTETVAYFNEIKDAGSALSHLLSELFFNDFLKNQLKEIGANLISVLLSNNYQYSISINFNFTPYENSRKRSTPECPNITDILWNATKIILPSIEPSRILIWNDTPYSSQCSSLIKIEPESTFITLLIIILSTVLGGAVLIAVFIALVKICYKPTADYSILPEEVRKYYEHGRDNSSEWDASKKTPLLYMTKITKKEEYNEILQIFEKLDGEAIDIQSIEAVYNPTLVEGFCNYRNILRARRENSKNVFDRKDWKQTAEGNVREFMYKVFMKRVTQFSWNEENELAPIIPVIHGTSRTFALKIAQNGFAATSLLDSGFYGKGIYFTSSALYATPYFATKKEPTLLICWLMPGNPYPVTENPTVSLISLSGHALFPGYQSHYVVTKINGMPIDSDSPTGEYFDEIVIEQEQQVVVGFLLTPDPNPESLARLVKRFNRDVVETTASNPTKKGSVNDLLYHEFE